MSANVRERCLVLASGSPRRRELLACLVDRFDVQISGIPEPVSADSTPAENILELARAKAAAIVARGGDCIVLAADTDVILDGVILGKPVDAAGAVAMLRRLRGREHEVLTAVVVVDPVSGERWDEVVSSRVRLRDLSDTEIDTYVATGEPMDKAGGYAIQSTTASMVDRIDGCYTNVVGLPLCTTAGLLRQCGLSIVEDVSRCARPPELAGRSCSDR